MVTIGFACADRQSTDHSVMGRTKSHKSKRKMLDFIKHDQIIVNQSRNKKQIDYNKWEEISSTMSRLSAHENCLIEMSAYEINCL